MTKTGKSNKHSKLVKLENHCDICDKIIIGSSYKFKSHLFKHNIVQERYNCEFCIKKFFRKDAYKTHVNRHKGGPQRTYTCDYCGRAFVLRNNLITHLKRIHDENVDTELGRFRCNICDLNYCEKRLLDQHVRRVHFNIQLIKEPLHTNKAINETWIENVNTKNATVSITKVNNNVIIIKQLKIDVKVNEIKPNIHNFNYSECTDQYSKGTCDYCKKEMLKKSLRTHIKEVHMNIRKFLCEVCKETFPRHYQLIGHKCGQFRSHKKRSVIKKRDLKTESHSKLLVLKKEF